MGATGGLGHLALQIGSRGIGLRMIAIDYGDKKAFAEECGANTYIDVSQFGPDEESQLAAAIKQTTPDGLGAAAVIVYISGNDAYAAAVRYMRFGGTVVCVGVPEGRPVPIATADPATLISQELRIVGSCRGGWCWI
ncbi:NAD(P)-binding protein [Aspergillus ellipticus CBS 707.79]|uniref:NAD(P)-binding protein n=1 Tax=Aspergillus ellipticus CBS 707.79 TaxID=1448320 RepID=A0A319CXC3_9EURO|nr:NAD(P)-binding protein [Aspergillus ellipticus CBS 707.79]